MLRRLRPQIRERNENMSIQDKKFITDSINLVAFLLTRGLEIKRTERLPDRPGWRRFVFGPEAAEIAQEYRKNLPVPVRDFARALRDVKTLTRRG